MSGSKIPLPTFTPKRARLSDVSANQTNLKSSDSKGEDNFSKRINFQEKRTQQALFSRGSKENVNYNTNLSQDLTALSVAASSVRSNNRTFRSRLASLGDTPSALMTPCVSRNSGIRRRFDESTMKLSSGATAHPTGDISHLIKSVEKGRKDGLELLKEVLDSQDKEINSVSERCSTLEDEITELHRKHRDLEDSIFDAENELTMLQHKKAQQSTEFEQQIAEYQRSIDEDIAKDKLKHEEDVNELKTKLLNEFNKLEQQDDSEFLAEKAKLTAMLADLNNQYFEMTKAANEELNREREEYGKELEEVAVLNRKTLDKLSTELRQSEQELEDSRNRLKKAKEFSQELSDELIKKKAELDYQSTVVSSFATERESLESELEKLETQLKYKQVHDGELEAQVRAAQAQLDEYEAKIKREVDQRIQLQHYVRELKGHIPVFFNVISTSNQGKLEKEITVSETDPEEQKQEIIVGLGDDRQVCRVDSVTLNATGQDIGDLIAPQLYHLREGTDVTVILTGDSAEIMISDREASLLVSFSKALTSIQDEFKAQGLNFELVRCEKATINSDLNAVEVETISQPRQAGLHQSISDCFNLEGKSTLQLVAPCEITWAFQLQKDATDGILNSSLRILLLQDSNIRDLFLARDKKTNSGIWRNIQRSRISILAAHLVEDEASFIECLKLSSELCKLPMPINAYKKNQAQ